MKHETRNLKQSVEGKAKGGLLSVKCYPLYAQKFISSITAKEAVDALTLLVLSGGITCFAASPSLRLSRYMALTYTVLAAMGLQLSLRSLPAGLFLVWTSVCFWLHPQTPILAALTAVLYGGGLFVLTLTSISRTWVYNLICLYAISNVLWQVLQLTGHTIGFNPIFQGSHTLVGLQTNVNETSALLAVCLPAFFRRHWACLVPIPAAGLVMAESTVGVMAAMVMACVWLIVNNRQSAVGIGKRLIIAATIILAGVGYVVFVDPFVWDNHKDGRLFVWKDTVAIAVEKPWAGWGYGQYSAVGPLLITPRALSVDDCLRLYDGVEDKRAFLDTANKITGGNPAAYYTAKNRTRVFFMHAHNEYLEVFFAAGILGLGLLVSALAHLLRRGSRQPDRRAFYGLLASCAAAGVYFTWQTVPIAVITVVWAGLCLSQNKEKEQGYEDKE